MLLRTATGGLLLFHGIYKLVYGYGVIKLLLRNHDWPESLSYGEGLGPEVQQIGKLQQDNDTVGLNNAISYMVSMKATRRNTCVAQKPSAYKSACP